MLAKRIIPCLDVKNGKVVKGVRFRDHVEVGDIVERAEYYNQSGADELVFYDITASCEGRTVDCNWIKEVARYLNIPFCVAGGIKNLKDAEMILNAGADKISINTPALENPKFIEALAKRFGTQCVVIGMDSWLDKQGNYVLCCYTGDSHKAEMTDKQTIQWIQEVQEYGAGEIVLNCMNRDGVSEGYDVRQLNRMRSIASIPLIASGGAGTKQHFLDVFKICSVDGALAASIFHKNIFSVNDLKQFLLLNGVHVRL
jgi:imidazole glycerol-phosphate synthase subunit HisF